MAASKVAKERACLRDIGARAMIIRSVSEERLFQSLLTMKKVNLRSLLDARKPASRGAYIVFFSREEVLVLANMSELSTPVCDSQVIDRSRSMPGV